MYGKDVSERNFNFLKSAIVSFISNYPLGCLIYYLVILLNTGLFLFLNFHRLNVHERFSPFLLVQQIYFRSFFF